MNYVNTYDNYQRYVTDKSIDEMVEDEMYSISYYLYEKGLRRKSIKLFLLIICSNLFDLKYHNVKLLLKKYLLG